MPTTGQHPDVAQQRHEVFHIGDLLGCAGRRHDHVVIARDVERRHRDLRPVERRHQLPIAIDVAIVRPAPPPLQPAQNLDPHRLMTLKLDLRFTCFANYHASHKTALVGCVHAIPSSLV
jgi:hypothetical protein